MSMAYSSQRSVLEPLYSYGSKVCTHGIFPIWKPTGLGSTTAVNVIKKYLMGEGNASVPLDRRVTRFRIFNDDFSSLKRKMWIKVGHGGTLDRAAEGILVIGVGRSCSKLGEYLLKKDKSYTFTGKLGEITNTLDDLGTVTGVAPWEHVTERDLQEALQKFKGTIEQVPPLFSAKKVKGVRMSDIMIESAKDASLEVPEVKPVQVTIKSLELLHFNPPFYTLSLSCTSGTYVRALARDLGECLGSLSYCTNITRTTQGELTQDDTLVESDWTFENIQHKLKEYHYNRRMLDVRKYSA